LLHHQELKLPELVDCRGEANPSEAARADARRIAAQPFQVLDHLLFRARLYQVKDQEHLFMVVAHQLVFDGWSFDLLLSELVKIYDALRHGKAVDLPPLPFEYRDYAHWQANRPANASALAFHRRALPSLPGASTDRGRADRKDWKLDKDALMRIERFCHQNELRLHEYFFSAGVAAFCGYRRQPKVTVGMPVTGRYSPEVIGQIGSFVSVLPCELTLAGDTFGHQARHLSGQIKTFLEHQDLTLGELLAETPLAQQGFPNFMEVSMSFQDIRNRPTQFAELGLRQVNMPRGQTELPVELWVRVQADGLVAVIDYDGARTKETELEPLGNLLLPYLSGNPERATVLLTPAAEPAPEADKKKPLWRRLFG
jgi:hypothetical protein